MKKSIFTLILCIIISGLLSASEKDIRYFIQKGWEHHSSIKQTEYDVKKYKNMELEAISTYTPKIKGMTWLAPMYTIKKTDDPWKTETDFDNWAPYYNLDLQFVQPLFAFTRVISGIKAARAGQRVAEQDVAIARWQVAKEIRLYYYGIVFANTMLKTINMADDMLSNAIEQAETAYEEGNTDITEVNISQLKYFYTQIPINRSFAEKSLAIAQEALFLATGERLAKEDFPKRLVLEDFELKEYDYYYTEMLANRPLLKKLVAGMQATRHLMDLEFKAMIPVLFAGGYIKFAAAPSVDIHFNKYLTNKYNTFIENDRGIDYGFAFGFMWDFDPMKAAARGLQQKADLDKLNELHSYAQQGFPVELEKTLSDLSDLSVKATYQKEAIEHSKTWMFFAANAYAMGDGEAKDVMEGLAAFVKAKTDYYQAVYDYNMLIGDLCEIVGIDVTTK